jgi:hypothetical protein
MKLIDEQDFMKPPAAALMPAKPKATMVVMVEVHILGKC